MSGRLVTIRVRMKEIEADTERAVVKPTDCAPGESMSVPFDDVLQFTDPPPIGETVIVGSRQGTLLAIDGEWAVVKVEVDCMPLVTHKRRVTRARPVRNDYDAHPSNADPQIVAPAMGHATR
jgi:hypothetical protein